MELFVIFSTAFIVGFSGAMMPGPLLTVTIGESARRGFIAGPMIVLGHAILELALILALAGGLSVFLGGAGVMHVIAILGGAFLVFMGYGMARSAAAGKVSLDVARESKDGDSASAEAGAGIPGLKSSVAGLRLHPVMSGILISLANPFWAVWWATVGLSYITLSLRSGVFGITSFFTGHILADLTWYCLIAAAVAGGRRFLSNTVYRGILVACGIFLVVLGGYFLYYGLST